MSEAEFKELLRKRSAIKGKVTNFKNKFKEFQSCKDLTSSHINELTLRLSRFEIAFNDFDILRDKLESLTDESAQLDEHTDIENDFFELINSTQEFIDAHKQGFCDAEDKSVTSNCQLNVKLPQIQLPSFDGNYNKWLEFRDTFRSIVHDNVSLNEINKFHYLRTSLQGSAANVINSLELTSSNYATAWQLICDRYDNKRQLISNHLQTLLNVEPILKESYKNLRNISDHINKNLRALDSLGEPTQAWDTLVVFLFASKLDPISFRKWEEHKNNLSVSPQLSDFHGFLRSRADVLESLSRSSTIAEKPEKQIHKKLDQHQKAFVASASSTKTTNSPKVSCLICNGEHRIFNCHKFLEMNPEMRSSEIYKLRVCPNCFRGGHRAYQCRAFPCKTCGRKHNSLLHRTYVSNYKEVASNASTSENKINNACPVSLSSCAATQVLLSTALVDIVDESEKCHSVRALLDCGSQSSFMTKSLQQRLGLTVQESKPIDITGINNISFTTVQRCNINIQSSNKSIKKLVNCFVIEQIASNLPSQEVDISLIDIPRNVKLADSSFHRPSQVQLLLGADVFWELITLGQIKLGKNKPVLQNSHFGWLVVGPTTCNINNNFRDNHKLQCNFSHEISVQLEKFWKLEELPQKEKWTEEEEVCEAHFNENTYRLPNGRFCVSLPLKDKPEKLGDSFSIAVKRLNYLEKRFARQPHVKEQYCEFIKEYEDLGHLTEVGKSDVANYFPHHPVLREKSSTTKCRVVFDGSCKTTSGFSLNDILMVGPTIQDDILSILIRFRQHQYVLVGDIEKMYRQILIDKKDRYLQTIIWRENSTNPLRYLQLNTVTYGTASAPFLSIRCLFEIAKSCTDSEIKTIIERDMYVDDVLTGCDSPEQLKYILQSLTSAFNDAQMPLRKIKSNCAHLFDNVGSFNNQPNVVLNSECTALGLNWNPSSDKLSISCSKDCNDLNQKCTKRTILSTIASIFDPLGILCLFTITLKIILQKLWTLKLDWDDEVPDSIKTMWFKIVQGLNTLSTFQINRCVFPFKSETIEIHCYSDASLAAYSACVYVRATSNNNNNKSVQLICAKARVAPLKPITIPRLELCGALLASRLYDKVKKSLRCKIYKQYFWTDSKIVLAWLNIYKTNKNKLKPFVAHRVAEITELSRGAAWRYVPTTQNPADLASRGVLPDQVSYADQWWTGPAYLLRDEIDWPSHEIQLSDVPEVKVTTKALNVTVKADSHLIKFDNYSSFNRLRRTVAYTLRFANNCQITKPKLNGPLNVSELQLAEMKLIKIAQLESFPDEINSLNQNLPICKKSKLLPLDPFKSEKGIMLVGGRLLNSPFNYGKRHPIILNSKHKLSKLIVEHFHIQLKHAGPQLLHSSIREIYWIIGGRQLSRSVYRNCILCKRLRGAVATQLMGNLPAQRVTPGFPFEVVAIDYAGPFYIVNKKGRGAQIIKTFLCIMCCLKTKAVHLELASDLSTQCFILALRRFIARRGKPREIFSDNGRNLVGANNEIGKTINDSCNSVSETFANEGIQFRFSPAYSPNFSGLIESAVKSAKYHIKRIIGNFHFTSEELATVFAQVEAILNSRPLCPLSSDPHDLSPLSPGHFLIGRPLTSLPAPDFTEVNPSHLHRYAKIEQVRQHFWSRWSLEYIAELQQRSKWRVRQPMLHPGQLVLIKDSQGPPLTWPLARIVKLHEGTDGLCRVVDVRTSKGTYRRAISKICPLLDDDNDDNNDDDDRSTS